MRKLDEEIAGAGSVEGRFPRLASGAYRRPYSRDTDSQADSRRGRTAIGSACRLLYAGLPQRPPVRALRPALVLSLALSLGAVPVASAETTVCTQTIGAVTVDNVVIPNGGWCRLNGTRVEGNIVVLTDSTLIASGVHVDGNIQAEGARAVLVSPGSFVGGNIQIVQGRTARIDRVTIDGDLQLFSNRGGLRATRNRIGGNLQADDNTGGLQILGNLIESSLQCKQNTPSPIGGGNQAGDKENQCAHL
jgi:hypothetical protein